MNLKEFARQDNLIMRALKVSEISHIVAKTNLGDLNFKLNYEGTENDYRFTLDAVPFEDKENKELIKLFEGSLYEEEGKSECNLFYEEMSQRFDKIVDISVSRDEVVKMLVEMKEYIEKQIKPKEFVKDEPNFKLPVVEDMGTLNITIPEENGKTI